MKLGCSQPANLVFLVSQDQLDGCAVGSAPKAGADGVVGRQPPGIGNRITSETTNLLYSIRYQATSSGF